MGFYYIHLGSKFAVVDENGSRINILNGGISLELFEDEIQITAYGIEGQQYEELFPYLIAAYEQKFAD